MKTHPMIVTLVLEMASASSPAQTVDEIEAGRRRLYMSNGCYSCHGTVGQGGERSAAPRTRPYPFEAFKIMVRQPREAMLHYDAKLVSDEQLQSMHRYLASVAKGPAAKDIP